MEGSDESWVGRYWGDLIASSGEDGSPLITNEMVESAASDPFNRFTLSNGTVLWFITSEKIGYAYADGKDNDGDGVIDENIDIGIDDYTESWVDGVDNDGDGFIDESYDKEKDNVKRYDIVVVLSCNKDIQKRRVLKRKGWNENRYEKIMKEQIPDYKKQTLADIIIKSDRGKRHLYQEIIKIIKEVKNKKKRKIYNILKEF